MECCTRSYWVQSVKVCTWNIASVHIVYKLSTCVHGMLHALILGTKCQSVYVECCKRSYFVQPVNVCTWNVVVFILCTDCQSVYMQAFILCTICQRVYMECCNNSYCVQDVKVCTWNVASAHIVYKMSKGVKGFFSLEALSHECRIILRVRNECHFLASVDIRFMPV